MNRQLLDHMDSWTAKFRNVSFDITLWTMFVSLHIQSMLLEYQLEMLIIRLSELNITKTALWVTHTRINMTFTIWCLHSWDFSPQYLANHRILSG